MTRSRPTYSLRHASSGPGPQEIAELTGLFTQGRYKDAEERARKLTNRFPLHWYAWIVLAGIVKQRGQLDEALLFVRKADKLRPGDANIQNNLGVILREVGQPCESERCYRRALEIKPDLTEVHYNLGNLLRESERLSESAASYRRALEIRPDYVEAHINLGINLKTQGRLVEAETCYRRALLIKPDHVDAYTSLGATLRGQGRLDEAELCYRQALQIKPDSFDAQSNLLFCLVHNVETNKEVLFREYARVEERFAAPLRATWRPHLNAKAPDRCLQVGFVSGDLRNHAVAHFIEPVLEYLAGYPSLSLHGYYNNRIEDSVTRRLRQYMPRWHVVAGLSDAALDQKIRHDGIDILIDLSGHTAQNRLLAFARKPAPVQASWIGYPGTTGLLAMDYFLSDRFLLPAQQFDAQFTESIVRLPAVAPFVPAKESPSPNALPAMRNGNLTFGSFNRISKISPTVVGLWAKILRALPNAHMVLGGVPKGGAGDQLIAWFAGEGIAPERLALYEYKDMTNYLGLHHEVDICLDTFPYAGGTTTCHALWMGVPTLTLAGDTVPGRTGVSVLSHVGLEACIAQNEADFVNKGIWWSNNLSILASLRLDLRERFRNAPIGQPKVIAAGLERALRIMWQRWCMEQHPEPFNVEL